MKNPLDTVKKWFILTFLVLALPGTTLMAQEGDGGGGSAAEAAVTSGGASTPAAAASGSTESNPVVTLVRAGLGFQNAKSIKIEDIKTIALAGGSLTNLVKSAVNIEKGAWKATDLVTLIKVGVSFEDTTGTLDLVNAGDLILTDVTSLLAKGLSITDAKTSAVSIKKGDTTLETVSSLIDAGLSAEDIAGAGSTNTALYISTRALTTNDVLYAATKQVIEGSTGFTNFQTNLETAVTFANTVLTDRTITSASDFDSIPEVSLASLTASPQTLEFIRLLGKYGAIGSDGSALSDTLAGAFFGTDFASDAKTGTNLLSFLGSNTNEHVGQLKTSLGTRTLPSGAQDSTVLQVSMSNVTLAPGANITVGASGSTSTIDVSDVLTKANSNEERKVAILGAAKDLTIAGDVTFTNTNTVEDHALVLGAADDLQLRGQDKDYVENEKVKLTYTGSNLGLGSNDTLRLINVDIKTGGNLAIGTLDDLYVGSGSIKDGGAQGQTHGITYSTTNGTSKFEVGVDDNVYLYANNLISINGLEFGTGMDDIYMDAITIDLSNVTFPQNSDVMLRSRDGSMQFGPANRAVGSVNFIENVKYGATTIESAGQFNGKDGHWDSTDLTLPNGKAAIKVRGF
ncbi:MAG: hypothetical protein HN727_08005 [Opitutae bacterium]|nr:hypothetical protein [Opitutae bacterium]